MVRWLSVVLIAASAGSAAAQPVPPPGRMPPDQPPRPAPPKPRPAHAGPVKHDLHGDPLPPGAVARYGTVRLRHAAGPSYLEFTRDGRFLVSAAADETLRVWDPVTGREVGRAAEVESFAGLPDGSLLLLRGNRLRVWSPGTGPSRELPRELIPPAVDGNLPVEAANGRNGTVMSVSPDGRTAAVGYPTQVHLIDLRAGDRRAVLNLPTPTKVLHLDFSPDGRWLAGSGSKTGVWLWDLRTGRRVRTYRAESNNETLAVFSRDGAKLFIAGDDVRAYPTDAEEPDPRFQVYESNVQDARLSPDGASLLVLEQDGQVARLDAGTGEVKETLPAPTGEVANPGALDPTGLLAAANGPGGLIRVWNPKTGDGPAVLPLPALGAVRISPDGAAAIALGEDNKVYTFGAVDGRHRTTVELPVEEGEGVSWDPRTGRAVYLGGGDNPELRVLDAATGKELGKLPYTEKGKPHVAFDPADPTRVAVFGPGGAVVTDITTGRPVGTVKFGTASDALLHGEFSPDGRLLVVSTQPVTVWELATGKPRFVVTAATDPRDILFSADGRLLAAVTGSDTVVLFDLRTGTPVRRIESRLDGGIYSAAFDAAGKLFAAGGRDGAVAVWDLTTGEPVHSFAGHDNLVNGVAFTPDGARLVTTSADGTALVWDLTAKVTPGGKAPVATAEEAFALLGAADPAEAQRGAAFLYRRPADTAKLLAEKLPVPKGVGRDTIARLIRELDSPDFRTRTAAARALENIGGEAATALRAAADKSPSAEVRKAAGSVLATLAAGPTRPDELRVVRAVEVAEHLGTPEARKLLAAWAAGPPGHRLTTEAATAAARLTRSKPEVTPPTGASP